MNENMKYAHCHVSAWAAVQGVMALYAAPLPTQPAEGGEARNVDGMTRAEFEAHLRVCYQHDNVRSRERGHDAPLDGLTADQEREIAKRVELNYPTIAQCPGCTAFDGDASEVHFVQGCEGCKARMQKVAGFGPQVAAPSAVVLDDERAAPVHLDEWWVDLFAKEMKDKLAKARAKGRGGWQDCAPETLSNMLREHVEKGDPRDVANFCMFLWANRSPIGAVSPQPVAQTERATFNMYPNEGRILASILRGMVEGGSGDPAVIYEGDYSAADGDVYVARAAELLDHYAAAQPASGDKA